MRGRSGVSTLCLLFFISGISWGSGKETVNPKLVLQITVDQLRGDIPTRYLDRLGSGGFRYLLASTIGDELIISNAGRWRILLQRR